MRYFPNMPSSCLPSIPFGSSQSVYIRYLPHPHPPFEGCQSLPTHPHQGARTQSRMQQHETCIQILTCCLAKMDDGISWLKNVKTPADSQGLYLDPAWAGAGFCCRFALPSLAISGLRQLGPPKARKRVSLVDLLMFFWCPNV